MNKNSTPDTPSNIVRTSAVAAAVARPRQATIDRLRQFARAYSYVPAVGTIGGIVLN